MDERNGPSEMEETRKMKYRKSKERKQKIEESGENQQDWKSGVVYKEQGQSTGVIDIGQCSIAAGLDRTLLLLLASLIIQTNWMPDSLAAALTAMQDNRARHGGGSRRARDG